MHTVTQVSITAAALVVTAVGILYISTHVDGGSVMSFFRSLINK
jgi:hypothetical protein